MRPTFDEILKHSPRENVANSDAHSSFRLPREHTYVVEPNPPDPLHEYLTKLSFDELFRIMTDCPCQAPGFGSRFRCRYCRMAKEILSQKHHKEIDVLALKHWYEQVIE